jgi:hypothetical protein
MLYTIFVAIKHGVLYSKAWYFLRSVHGIRSRSQSKIALCVTGRKISPNIRQPNKQRNNSWGSRGYACGRRVGPKHRRLCRGIDGWDGKLQRRIRPSLNWVDVGSPNFSEASWGSWRSSDERKILSRLVYAVPPRWVSVMDPVAWEFWGRARDCFVTPRAYSGSQESEVGPMPYSR